MLHLYINSIEIGLVINKLENNPYRVLKTVVR